MKVICITGTPATGKTTVAEKLSNKIGYPILDVKKFIKKRKLSEGYDKKKKCDIIDITKLNKEIIKEINKTNKEHNPKGIIVDSHLSHYLPKKIVDLCIVTKCDLKELNKRLKKRKYDKDKIKENIECEIFDICLNEAKENKHRVLVVDTTKGINISKIFRKEGEIKWN